MRTSREVTRVGFGLTRQRALAGSVALPAALAYVLAQSHRWPSAVGGLALLLMIPLVLRARRIGLESRGEQLAIVDFFSATVIAWSQVSRVGFDRPPAMSQGPTRLRIETRRGVTYTVRGVSRNWPMLQLPGDEHSKAESRVDRFLEASGSSLRCDSEPLRYDAA